MQQKKSIFPIVFLSAILLWAIWQNTELKKLSKDAKTLSSQVRQLHAQQEALKHEISYKPKDQSEIVLTELDAEPDLEIPISEDISLSLELQEFVYKTSRDYEVPYSVVLAIMEHESRFIWHPAKMDTNGLLSVGYMQINEPHWERLQTQYNVDVNDPEDNIEAGIIILSELLEKYPLEKALVCYQCGEAGALGIDSTEFSRWVIERSEDLI